MTKNDLGDSDNDKDMTLTVKMTMTNMNFSTNGLPLNKTHVLETGSNRTRPCHLQQCSTKGARPSQERGILAI